MKTVATSAALVPVLLAVLAGSGCSAAPEDARQAGVGTSESASVPNELPLVARRTRIASDAAARLLSCLPEHVRHAARCVAVMSKDTIGWGMGGVGIGGGLVSCRTSGEAWSAPSYLALMSVDIGPSIGILDEDTAIVFTQSTMDDAFHGDFDFRAGVYATAGAAHVELSVDSDGCFMVDVRGRRERNCAIAITERAGLEAGANIRVSLVRHMTGLLGGSRVGRNARVYYRGVTVREILTTPGPDMDQPIVLPWVDTLTQLLP